MSFACCSKGLEDEEVEGLEEDVVPEHHDEGLRRLAETFSDEADYIGKVPEEGEKGGSTYFLPTAISPGWRSAVFSLAKRSSAGARS